MSDPNYRSNIVWQDTLLSLCHARRPLGLSNANTLGLFSDVEAQLNYAQFMHAVCQLSLSLLNNDSRDIPGSNMALDRLDALHHRTLPYLQFQDKCKSSLENLQYFALKMHKSFITTYICRPAIKNPTNSPISSSPEQQILRRRAEDNLIDAINTFLDFRAVSSIPLRSWSMIHTVLSSVLLLCIWDETRTKPQCQILREQVIEAFSSPETMYAEATDSAPEYTQWLSQRHIRALITLKDAFTSDPSGIQVDFDMMQEWNQSASGARDDDCMGFPDIWDPLSVYANNFAIE